MLKRVLMPCFALVIAVMSFAQNVNVDELRSAGDENAVVFESYEGPHTVIESRAAITAIGTRLGDRMKAAGSENAGTYGSGEKYTLVHAVDPDQPGKLDADILILNASSSVDHITNLRRIISGYLQAGYGYSADDAATIAVFVTVYNAVYRGKLDTFRSKYKDVVMETLTATKCGLSLKWREWPGNTQIVIPLGDYEEGGLSSVETSVISDKNVVQSMREEDGKGIEDRKNMVDIKEREAEAAEAKAQEAAKTAAGERQALSDQQKQQEASEQAAAGAQKKADEAQLAADKAQIAADEAQKAADEAQAHADEAQKAADEAQTAADEAQKAASDAQATAEDARAARQEAESKAQTAKDEAAQAQSTADEAQAQADEAKAQAAEAKRIADENPDDAQKQQEAAAAQTAADEAQAAADEAQKSADEAQKSADEAQAAADEAKVAADQAQEEAQAAQSEAEQKQQQAQAASQEAQEAKEEAAAAEEQAQATQKQAEQASQEAQEAKEEAAAAEDKAQEEREKTAEQQQKADEAQEVAEEEQKKADKKQSEAQAERSEIAEDQKELVEEEIKQAQDGTVVGLKVSSEGDGGYLCALVKVNAKTGQLVKESAVKSIRGRTIFEVSTTLEGDKGSSSYFLAVCGENSSGNSAVKLCLLAEEDLQIHKESQELVSQKSTLIKDGDNFYCIIENGSSWAIGRYDKDLTLQAKSSQNVDQSTPITITKKGIVATGEDGKSVLLTVDELVPVSGM